MSESEDKKFYRLQRWMISTRDFQIAKSAATFLLEEVDEKAGYPLAEIRKFKCYETTMVVAYARPFSMAKGPVGPLSEKEAGLRKSDPFYTLHSRLIHERNTLFGHSDAEHVDMRVWNIKVDDDFSFPLPRFGEHLSFTMAEVDQIHEQMSVFMGNLTRRTFESSPRFQDRFLSVPDDEPVRKNESKSSSNA